MSSVQHCKDLLFHEATFIGLPGENTFCLAPGTLTVTLGLAFELLIGRQSGRCGTAYATDKRADALSEAGRELGDGGVWRVRTATPGGVVVFVVVVIGAILAVYLSRIGIYFEPRAQRRGRPRARVVVAVDRLWLQEFEFNKARWAMWRLTMSMAEGGSGNLGDGTRRCCCCLGASPLAVEEAIDAATATAPERDQLGRGRVLCLR